MSYTKIDCALFRGPQAQIETSSYVLVNPEPKPGRVVFAGSVAAGEALGSQVASRLSVEHFVDQVALDYQNEANSQQPDFASQVLKSGFKNANASVYSFGHKLAAGGRLSTGLIGMVLDGETLAVGRCGVGSAYLFRDGQLFPFFEGGDGGVELDGKDLAQAANPARKSMSLVGVNSVVDVEIASVDLNHTDAIIVCSRQISKGGESLLPEFLDAYSGEFSQAALLLSEAVLREPESVSFMLVLGVGPEAMYLS